MNPETLDSAIVLAKEIASASKTATAQVLSYTQTQEQVEAHPTHKHVRTLRTILHRIAKEIASASKTVTAQVRSYTTGP